MSKPPGEGSTTCSAPDPRPATRAALATDECVSAVRYTRSRPSTPVSRQAPPEVRCRAASSATSAADDAESWMQPPPPPAKVNSGAEAERGGEPVQQHLLHLGGRGRGGPEHALRAQPGREHVAEQRVQGGVGREVAEEAGMLPVRAGRQHDPVELGQQRLHRLRRLGQLGGQLRPHPAGPDRRAHRPLGPARPGSRRSSRRPRAPGRRNSSGSRSFMGTPGRTLPPGPR